MDSYKTNMKFRELRAVTQNGRTTTATIVAPTQHVYTISTAESNYGYNYIYTAGTSRTYLE